MNKENQSGKNKAPEAVETTKKAILVSAYQDNRDRQLCLEHLEELDLLVQTYGAQVVDKIPCHTRKFEASTYLTSGKLEEIKQLAQELEADLVIFDDEILPSQQRNLENFFGVSVMDRTEIILHVFSQRAQTKEARLQIQLAQTKYQAPRLKRLWTHLSRQAGTGGMGGGAYLKGEGEKQIEIDRRILKQKIDRLQKEIQDVRSVRETQRLSRIRSEIPVFAIIGYTNAGKSTLLNALTDAGVFVENKLFVTLDTTTRKFTLPNKQEILLIDTVGFIRKLPHLLVAAFRSTLEEAIQADILIHLVDISHPMAEEQAATTYEVLKELGASDTQMITVFNKMDLCQDMSMATRLRLKYPKSVCISALEKTGLEDLFELMMEELSRQRKIVMLRIPQSDYAVVSEVQRQGHIYHQEYEENDVLIRASIPVSLLNKLNKYLRQ